MADKSVFEMSGPASEKLAALQTLSYSERPSTYDHELSKLVCSYMKPVVDANHGIRRAPRTDLNGIGEPSQSKPLPFNILKPTESWSEVGVRTVADLKTAISSKSAPVKNSTVSDRALDWRLRSSLYFDPRSERKVRLSYKMLGITERADSPPLNMEVCTSLTSGQVLDAMKVLAPPKKPTPCKPYLSPTRNSPPRPEGKLPLNNIPVSVPCRKKPYSRPPTSTSSIVKQGSTGKARMKFTKRRSELEKDLLEQNFAAGVLAPLVPSKTVSPLPHEFNKSDGVPSENNNGNHIDNNRNEIVRDVKWKNESSKECVPEIRQEPIASEQLPSHQVSPQSEHAALNGISRSDDVSSQDKVLVKSQEQLPSAQKEKNAQPDSLRLAQQRGPQPAAHESDDVEFFEMSVVDSNNNVAKEDERKSVSAPAVVSPDETAIKAVVCPEISSTLMDCQSPTENRTQDVKRPHTSVGRSDVATQTQQSQELQVRPDSQKPKAYNLFELYKAVTKLKSKERNLEAQAGSSREITPYLVK